MGKSSLVGEKIFKKIDMAEEMEIWARSWGNIRPSGKAK